MTEPEVVESAAGPDAVEDLETWRRLDPRTVPAGTLMTALVLVGVAVPTGIGLVLGGVSAGWIAFWLVGGIVVGTIAIGIGELIRVRVSAYRLTPERVERRVQFLGSSRTSIARERVRNVEITADIVQRRFGVADVRLGTGESKGADFTLKSLDRAFAESLRELLVGREESGEGPRVGTLSTLDRGWLRYAPISFLTPLLGLAAFGIVVQVSDWFNMVPRLWGWFTGIVDRVGPLGVVVAILAIILVVGTIASMAIFVESWWNYQLDRSRNGALRVQRGLFVHRSTNFEGERIRGMALVEPPGVRRMGAARLDIIAVGLNTSSDENGKQRQSPTVMPAAPRELSEQVIEKVLGHPVTTTLRAHPPAARSRRMVRAAVAGIVMTLVVLVATLLWWPGLWWLALVTLVIGGGLSFWIAVDNSRGLGHALTDDQVVLRRGSVFRRTEILNRRGLLSWNIRQTPFQRRSGLVTLVATSAAGSGSFRLPDVGAEQIDDVIATAGPVWSHLAE